MPPPTNRDDDGRSYATASVSYPSLLGRVIVLTGSTASGKTDVAIAVAKQLADHDQHPTGVEIVSLDSMAVYCGMDIGVAKPTAEQREQVSHHLIDVVNPDQEFSVAEYLQRTHKVIDQIHGRGHHAMLVGGTPMYLKAILRGFHPGPPPDEVFRRQVAEDVRQFGLAALRDRLRQVDPISASRIDPSDERRMTRALEFAFHVGVPISHHQIQFDRSPAPSDGLVFTLQTSRPILHERIARRTDAMFHAGLPDEVVGLLRQYGHLSKTACKGVGYRELLPWAESVLHSKATSATGPNLDEAREQVLFHTRRLARRQSTWIRSFSEMRPIETHAHGQPIDIEIIAGKIADAIAQSGIRLASRGVD